MCVPSPAGGQPTECATEQRHGDGGHPAFPPDTVEHTMSVQGNVKDGKLTLTIDLAKDPYISNSEAAKAAKEGRTANANMLASSGGFTRIGDCKVSFNVMKG